MTTAPDPTAAGASVMPYFRFEIHPIDDRAFWHTVATDPRTREMAQSVRAVAAAASPLPAVPLASEFRAAKWHNDRHKLDHFWQHHRGTFGALCVARCLDGNTSAAVDTTLLDWLWGLLMQPTWVVSAHLPNNDLPDPRQPQHDLAACEMAAGMAEALVLLRPWIDNQSQTLASTIVHEIDRRVLTPFVALDNVHWGDLSKPAMSNWSGVCAGSILAACEALAEAGEPRPAARAKALRLLDAFFHRAFTASGECDEGVGYWSYGVGFAALGLSRLDEPTFRAAIDQDRFRQVANYPRRVHLFDDYFFSGNDANLQSGPPAFATPWLGAASGSQWLVDWTPPSLKETQHWRALPVLLRGIDARLHLPADPMPLPKPQPVRFLPDQQTAIVADDKLLITFSGGHNAELHNHNDLGHFCLWCDGKLIVPDMGAPQYTADFFGPKRYEYVTASSRGHCCPVINGYAQRSARDAQGVIVESDLQKQRFAIDMTSAYPNEAGLKKWVRSFERTGVDTFEIVDRFDVERDSEIETVVWSLIEPTTGPTSLTLGPVAITFTPTTTPWVKTHSSSDLKLRTPEQPLYQIGLPMQVAAGKTLEVRMTIGLAK